MQSYGGTTRAQGNGPIQTFNKSHILKHGALAPTKEGAVMKPEQPSDLDAQTKDQSTSKATPRKKIIKIVTNKTGSGAPPPLQTNNSSGGKLLLAQPGAQQSVESSSSIKKVGKHGQLNQSQASMLNNYYQSLHRKQKGEEDASPGAGGKSAKSNASGV